MHWPKITIVTPTFERVEFLEECIQSVIQQKYPNLEYIVCDGGSKNPAVLELIRKYGDRLSWWDSKPDRGHAEAIRRGFDHSSGEIMNWLCSDDYLLPGSLLAVGEAFRKRPNVDIVYGHSLVIDAQGRVTKVNRAIPYCGMAAFTTCCLFQPSAFWSRRIYDHVGGNVGGINWENVIYEPNVDLLCRFQKSNARFLRIQTMLTAIRIHDGTVGATANDSVRKVSQQTFRRYYPICGRRPIYHTIFFVMRFYQILALLLQGDWRYVCGEIRRKLVFLFPRQNAARCENPPR